jgi:FAD/FMN-containing dehydrogenase
VMAAWDALGGAIEGDVVLPGSDGYDRLRTPAMARFRDVRPAGIVRCRTAADVAEALAFARGWGWRWRSAAGATASAGARRRQACWWTSGR